MVPYNTLRLSTSKFLSLLHCHVFISFSTVESMTYASGETDFPQIYEQSHNCRNQKGDINQVPIRGPQYIRQISNRYYLYSVGTQQIIVLSIYKSGNMFRLNEPSSGQFINHIEGICNRCARCGIPDVYKSYDYKRYK